MNDKPEKLIDKKGLRLDGRKPDELRPVKLEVGVIPNANGSAYIEHGKNKILAAVYGPRPVTPRQNSPKMQVPHGTILRPGTQVTRTFKKRSRTFEGHKRVS